MKRGEEGRMVIKKGNACWKSMKRGRERLGKELNKVECDKKEMKKGRKGKSAGK